MSRRREIDISEKKKTQYSTRKRRNITFNNTGSVKWFVISRNLEFPPKFREFTWYQSSSDFMPKYASKFFYFVSSYTLDVVSKKKDIRGVPLRQFEPLALIVMQPLTVCCGSTFETFRVFSPDFASNIPFPAQRYPFFCLHSISYASQRSRVCSVHSSTYWLVAVYQSSVVGTVSVSLLLYQDSL